MAVADTNSNRQLRTIFRGRRLPTAAYLVGYSELIDRYDIGLPLHHEMAAISPKNLRRKEDGWIVLPIALQPSDDVVGHLVFALKNEGIQLLALKKIFQAFDKTSLERAITNKPTSAYLRRLCFLYEWLTHQRLSVPDTAAGAYVDLVDTKQQYGAISNVNSRRFRIRDNLPGSYLFCPLVFKTRKIDELIGRDLSTKAKAIVKSAPKELIARAAAFLLLSDSKASFAIEGERPPRDRIARWGNVLSKAGQVDLDVAQLERLQRELIGDDRFVDVGLREGGGFVGRHDAFGQPEPEHLSARATDLHSLVGGLLQFDEDSSVLDYHPVLAAASLAFGFVYIHPFEDGNGRIHRFLIHHVLSRRGFTPEEIILPVSSAILDDIPRYREVLESISRPLLDWINWTPTETGNVEILQDTSDFYRYFDATAHTEYLFKCIDRAVEKDLPEELAFLEHRDAFHRRVTLIVDMGERTLDLLLRFLRQGHGSLSKRAMSKEFAPLTEDEIQSIEQIYADLFDEMKMNVSPSSPARSTPRSASSPSRRRPSR
jgi:hypothetical protein